MKSPEKLLNDDVKDVVSVWNMKDRRSTVYTLLYILCFLLDTKLY